MLLRIQQLSAGALQIEKGSLYPALYRLERAHLLKTHWGTSDNNRRAKFYELTQAGERRLHEETESWKRLALAMRLVLSSTSTSAEQEV